MLTLHNNHTRPLMRNHLFFPSSCIQAGTIRSKNKQAPQTKIGSSQEPAVRVWLNRGKQAKERKQRDRDSAYRPGADSVVAIGTAWLG